MENLETTNINIKWLENIYEQLKTLQNLERMASEGCQSLGEYLQIPPHLISTVIPEARYNNMRFFALEMKILIDNLFPIIEEDAQKFKDKLDKIIEKVDKKHFYIKAVKKNNQETLEVLNLLPVTVRILEHIKSEIIKSIAPILYIKENNKKKTW